MKRANVTWVLYRVYGDDIPELGLGPEGLSVQTLSYIVCVEILPSLYIRQVYNTYTVRRK